MNEAILGDMQLCAGVTPPVTFILGASGLKKPSPRPGAVLLGERLGGAAWAPTAQALPPQSLPAALAGRAAVGGASCLPTPAIVPHGPEELCMSPESETKRPEFLGSRPHASIDPERPVLATALSPSPGSHFSWCYTVRLSLKRRHGFGETVWRSRLWPPAWS